MKIDNLKDLERFFKVCRKQGIVKADLSAMSFEFGDLPEDKDSPASVVESDPVNPYANFPEGELTPEQLMFYSAGGTPDEDPYLKENT